jgi:hypothetical protein
MRPLITFLLLATTAFAQPPTVQLGALNDAVSIREFYRLSDSESDLARLEPDVCPTVACDAGHRVLMHRAEPVLNDSSSCALLALLRI